MTNYLKIVMFIVLFTQFILSEVKIVSEKQFNNLLNEHACKNIKYGKCYDFLDEIILFRNHQKNNFLKSDRIFVTETPKKSNFKHMYEISKNGMVYYLPKYILEVNSSKIDREHTISVGDEILVYHLFNKVFFFEIIYTHVEEIKPTYVEETNSKSKITEITNNQLEIIEITNNQPKKIDYSGPILNSKGGYDIRLTEKDFKFVKKHLNLSKNYKDLSSFVKILDDLNNKNKCDFFLNIEYEKTNDGIILKNLQIREFKSDRLRDHYKLSELYKPSRKLFHDRMHKEKNTKWNEDYNIAQTGLWKQVLGDTKTQNTLRILTFCLNLNTIYSGRDSIRTFYGKQSKSSLVHHKFNRITIVNTENNKLWVLKLFEGKGVTL